MKGKMNRLSERKKNILLLLVSLSILFLLSISFDSILGLVRPEEKVLGLIFPPQTQFHYQTPEFAYTAKINSLGFRDREFDLNDKDSIRIISIGDSFTYGWGVENDQSWPKILEKGLLALGYNIEVANLGRPGGFPRTYAEVAKKAIPFLKPDLTIIAVSQGDDIAQLKKSDIKNHIKKVKTSASSEIRRNATMFFKRVYPNAYILISSYRNRAAIRTQPLADIWKTQVNRLIEGFTPQQRSRFESLDKHVKKVFMDGGLNPSLLEISITLPEYFLETFDINNAHVHNLILDMAKYFYEIKQIANKHNSHVIVVPVPYGPYVSHRDFETRQRLGFKLVPEMMTSNSADDAIRLACERSGVQFISVTDGFRKKAANFPLFFELDGHLNSEGHEQFANLLAPLLKNMIDDGILQIHQ